MKNMADPVALEVFKKCKIKVQKLHQDAVLPARAKEGDAGYDLVAIDNGTVSDDGYIQYRTGLAIEPSEGFHTQIWPRSSISKYDLVLANSIGLVDNGYRGELLVRFKPVDHFYHNKETGQVFAHRPIPPDIKTYKKGDKIAQLVIIRTEEGKFWEVQELADSSRGTGGFGSSGN